ncbi:hypothetical protein IAQ61_004420 [Plenodomus lingam]|uniref:uncharacterized protein n=1 Tax=Leptosphaeria maculans TaxID=5022 RepID=UPI00332C8A79|nr:hypothetical protein IAQ61_004420 [Plenodomus lingam]
MLAAQALSLLASHSASMAKAHPSKALRPPDLHCRQPALYAVDKKHRMKYSFVAATLVGAVLAIQHHGHAGFHARRGGYEVKQEDVCTVYTTVYVTAPAPVPTAVTNSTTGYPEGNPPVCTSCKPETPIQTPVVLSSTHGAPVPSKEAHPPVPVASKESHPPASVPASSTPCEEEEVPTPTPAVPVASKDGQPPAPVPASSTPCDDEDTPAPTPVISVASKDGHPPASVPATSTPCDEEEETPAPTPVVPVPASSTPCDEEEETPAPTPVVPVASTEATPSAPAPTSSAPCTDEEETPAYTPAPVPSQAAYPPGPKPETPKPEVPKPEVPKPETPAPPSQGSYPPGPKPETPKPEVPKPETPAPPSQGSYPPGPKPETPKSEVPKPETPAPVPSQGSYPPGPKPEAPKPETPTPKPETPKPETPSPAPSTSKAADKPKPTGGYSSGGRIETNGDKWAITYTPYAANGNCKTQDEIKEDIKKISELGFTTIRSYSTDCGVFEFVVPECQKYKLKIIYGIFLEGAGKGPFSEYANAQLEDIKEKAPKDSVAMVIVGNECMFNNNCPANELASYIDYVRTELQKAGFPQDIAITTTETVGVWEEKGAALCGHIDVFTVQVHPFFTSTVSAEDAGDFAAQQLEQAAKVCPEAAAKGMYITEIGWPSAGQTNGNAVASKEMQKVAMKKIMEKVGSKACVFSFQDDFWKPPGSLGVEQNFGILDALTSY